jgi:Uma2 family endonuclease
MKVQPQRQARGRRHGTEAATRERQAPAGDCASPLVVRLRPALELSEDQFFRLCQINRDLRIERNAEGELLIMPPSESATGDRNSEINMQLRIWAKQDGSGLVFDSSAGFTLPNGAIRAPDAAWVARSRWGQIPREQRERFAPICPDFVLELRSPSDALGVVQDKLAEYLANGARLGWLLDLEPRHVYVYRPGAPVERLEGPESVSGDPVLPGFTLNLCEIWM